MSTLSTGEIAELPDVNIHIVRYYEERDLLPTVPRSAAGHRQVNDEHLAHIRFVKRAQELGLTLEEIRELLSVRATSNSGEEVRKKQRRRVRSLKRRYAT